MLLLLLIVAVQASYFLRTGNNVFAIFYDNAMNVTAIHRVNICAPTCTDYAFQILMGDLTSITLNQLLPKNLYNGTIMYELNSGANETALLVQ